VLALQHLSEIGVGIDVKVRGEGLSAFGRDVAHGYEFGVWQRLIRESMRSGNFAATYDGSSQSDWIHFLHDFLSNSLSL
jgi:hypothetical protein